jgi:large subunit ribosomal protein L35
MPKQKTHRGAAKRFKVTPSGKIKRRRAFANHFLGKKSSHRKRRLNSPTQVAMEDKKTIRRLLGS